VKESSFWALVKKNLSPSVHASRIENSAGAGQSDVNACRDGVETWIELKIQHGNMLEFRASQPVWIRERMRARGRVAVLARKGDEILLYSPGVCFGTRDNPPAPVPGKKAVKVRAADCYVWFRTSKPFDWRALEDKIFERW
jgi:hypothetical protein